VKAADAACDFFTRYLRHTEGEWAGQPFVLADWERDLVRRVFGWKRPDGSRLVRTVYLEVPRKNGKTEFAAGLALLLLVGDAEYGGQGYAMAVDKDQAKLVFQKATTMVHLSPELRAWLEPLKTSIYCSRLVAAFKPITSKAQSKHGFSPSFAIGDEIHAWPDGELADVVHKGTAARRQPLEIYTTTAGRRGHGFGWEMHDRALKILRGELVDPTFLAVIFAADDGDDWRDEATWRKANPNLGVAPKLEYLRQECTRALESPRLENEFKRYHLNLWTDHVSRWLSIENWDAGAGKFSWKELERVLAGRECFAGVDLSTTTDLTAVVYVFPPLEDEIELGPWGVLCRFFLPVERLVQAERRDRLPYRRWVEQGALLTTPGNVVDYEFIEACMIEDASRFRIREAAFDPWNATQFATRMMGEGMTMVAFRQGYYSLNGPSKGFERLVESKRLRHGGHPVLREMAKAVSVATDAAGCIKPDKSRATLRIDGIVAGIMGVGRAMVAPAATETLSEAIKRRAAAGLPVV